MTDPLPPHLDKNRDEGYKLQRAYENAYNKWRFDTFPNAKKQKALVDKNYAKNNHKKLQAKHKEYYSRPETKARLNSFSRQKRANNKRYSVEIRLRTRMGIAIRRTLTKKSANTYELIGCSLDFLIAHLESKFYPDSETGEMMTWENRSKWHIDHIKPCSRFDLTKEEEQKECFHWSNLQPLWAKENLIKHDAYLSDCEPLNLEPVDPITR